MDWAKTTAWGYKTHLSFGIWCDLYKRFYGMSSYQYRKSHCGDNTVVRSSNLNHGDSYTGRCHLCIEFAIVKMQFSTLFYLLVSWNILMMMLMQKGHYFRISAMGLCFFRTEPWTTDIYIYIIHYIYIYIYPPGSWRSLYWILLMVLWVLVSYILHII